MSEISSVSRRRLLQGAAVLGAAVAGAAAVPVGAARATAANPFTGPPVIRDRAYVANERSGTISVVDTTTHTIRTTIGLGSDPAIPGTPQPAGPFNAEADHLKPFYDGHVAPHGLWLTPDASVLLVACRISGTVVALDTLAMESAGTAGGPGAPDPVLGYTPVGREPHLATVHPGGAEAWVAVRGEDYLEVLKLDRDDLRSTALKPTRRMESTRVVDTAEGPSMVAFDAAGTAAFVVFGKAPVVEKYSTGAVPTRMAAQSGLSSPFAPFGLVTPDDSALYVVHKGAGRLSVLRTTDLSFVRQEVPVGARANHVEFAGDHAYVVVGGPAPSATNPDPEGRVAVYDLRTHTEVGQLAGPAMTGEPHAAWAVGPTRLYIGHERGNRVTVLDTSNPTAPQVVGTVTGSPRDLGLLRQPIDVVATP